MGKQKSSTSSSKKTSGAEERGSNSLGEDEGGGGEDDEEQKEEEEMSLRSEDPLVAARATTAMSRNSSGQENGRRYGIRLFIFLPSCRYESFLDRQLPLETRVTTATPRPPSINHSPAAWWTSPSPPSKSKMIQTVKGGKYKMYIFCSIHDCDYV